MGCICKSKWKFWFFCISLITISSVLWFQRNLVWLRFWVNYRTKHSHYTRYYCHWNLRLKSYWTRSASLRPMEVYPNRARPARIRSRKRRPMIVWQGTYFFYFPLVKLIGVTNWLLEFDEKTKLRAIIFGISCNRKRKSTRWRIVFALDAQFFFVKSLKS